MTASCFDYNTFVNLSGHALAEYMEPIISTSNTPVTHSDGVRIIDMLYAYDEEHLIYALLASSKSAPERLAPLLPAHLTDSRSSVCSTAFNILNALSSGLFTEEIMQSIRNMHALHPNHAYLGTITKELEQRYAGFI